MKEKKLILFNLGGALLLSSDKCVTLWCTAIREAGLRPNFDLIYHNLNKSFQKEIIPLLSQKGGWSDKQELAVVENSKKLFNDVNFNSPANLDVKLIKLKKAGYDLGIITNQSKKVFLQTISDIDLDPRMFTIIKTGDSGAKKPNPEVFNSALEKYTADQIIFVGDSPDSDLLAANSGNDKIDFAAISSPTFPMGLFISRGVPRNMIFESVIDFIDSLK